MAKAFNFIESLSGEITGKSFREQVEQALSDLISKISNYNKEVLEASANAQAAADAAESAAQQAEDLVNQYQALFDQAEINAELNELYLLTVTLTAATTAHSFTSRDISAWWKWWKDGMALLTKTGYAADYQVSTSLLNVSDRDTELEHRNLLIRTYVEKPLVVFIVAGQSNAVGFCRPIYEAATYCGQFWDWTTGVNALKPLKDPTNAWSPTSGSAWPAFARQFFALTGRKIVILNVARGGAAVTNHSSNTWYGDDETNTLRVNAKTQYDALAAALGDKGTNWVLGGLLWIQGEAECAGVGAGSIQVSEYISGTLDVFRFFREMTGETNMPVYVSQIGYQASVETNPSLLIGYNQIQAAQSAICQHHANDFMVFEGAKNFLKAGYMYDTIHYSQYGYNIVGEAFARFISNNQSF